MPKNVRYQIGDIIKTPIHGDAMILGTKPFADPQGALGYYLVYYFKSKSFQYAVDMMESEKSWSLVAAATHDSIQKARDLVLMTMTQKNPDSQFEFGDIINVNDHEWILLDNGHLVKSQIDQNKAYPPITRYAYDQKTIYHVYIKDENRFMYTHLHTGHLPYKTPGNTYTRKLAASILCNHIYSQLP